ncbi:MAG TPA: ADP-ribosylglycohydrolase family protein [Gammaproteobacteria bacterium]|nr:ADP-ribosylglycohydrolase family protein [Gammaproteobacteria bacterium]
MEGDAAARLARARLALDGLSLGDAFGELFFDPALAAPLARGERPALPDGPWPWTDDTALAAGVVEVLGDHAAIDPDALAAVFGRDYAAAPGRGYGRMAAEVLAGIADGGDWRALAAGAFGGAGSLGNGGAMRAAPVGAYFADDPGAAAENAQRSAAVTHAHAEGQAGAVAVALAAAGAARGEDPLAAALAATPEGDTRRGLATAAELPVVAPVGQAAAKLGNGSGLTAPDTVPFALWCAARHAGDYDATLWAVVSGGGDCDTTGAIAGGVAVMASGRAGLPEAWLAAREPLPRAAGR